MPTVEAVVSCEIPRSFKIDQIAGMFDITLEDRVSRTFSVEIPDPSEDWTIGAIVGPSGSGKSSVARKFFGDAMVGPKWSPKIPVIEQVEASVQDATAAFTAVGFSSPPAWIRPYRTLSNGEAFRADVARRLLAGGLVVIDEFTSVVDRQVAMIASSAIAKAVRTRGICERFVAVTCHYDVLDWLEPDWVLDMNTGRLTRGRLHRRPPIPIEVRRCNRSLWGLFAPHHYLSSKLHRSATTFVGLVDGVPASFVGILPSVGKRGVRRVSRVVTLPDFQGVGIGGITTDTVAAHFDQNGYRMTLATSHPGFARRLAASPKWRTVTVSNPSGDFQRPTSNDLRNRFGSSGDMHAGSTSKFLATFEFKGASLERTLRSREVAKAISGYDGPLRAQVRRSRKPKDASSRCQ
jgi:hypothetical protein